MNVKEIIQPEVRETFFYGRILSWKFNNSIVYIKARKKYCYRVLLTFSSGLPWNRSFKDKAYKRVVNKCGFKYIEWRKLRTTYASILSEYNVSMKAISMSLGHYSADFTKDVYVKSQMKVIDVASLIEPYMSRVLVSEPQNL